MARKHTPPPAPPAQGAGARLAGLRASNAARPHDPRPHRRRTRGQDRRAAIADARTSH